MEEIIKLANAIGKQLNLKPCPEEDLMVEIRHVSNLIDEEDILGAMKEFLNGKIIFNCDGGDGDYYYYLKNNKIRCFTPESEDDELTEQEVRENSNESLIDSVFSLMCEVFLGESTWVSSFNKDESKENTEELQPSMLTLLEEAAKNLGPKAENEHRCIPLLLESSSAKNKYGSEATTSVIEIGKDHWVIISGHKKNAHSFPIYHCPYCGEELKKKI